MIRTLASLVLLMAAPVRAQDGQQRIDWNRPAQPFRLIGNVHYVGTEGLSAFLVTSPAGHILIDGALPESAPLILANIRRLGFRPRDVRYLLLNHAHYDHAGGLAELKRETGARVLVSAGDAPDLRAGRTRGRPELAGFPAVRPDRIVRDGEQVRLGEIRMTANLTPGHTSGCTSWSTVTAGKQVLFACSLTVAGRKLVEKGQETRAADEFRRTFDRLRAMKADVFLNFHPEAFDIAGKRARQQAGNAQAFVDPGEHSRQVERADTAFRQELARQRR
jgi:metallo-beta-lactamase class B